MRLRTDDDIYRARLVWLGPPGYTLPVQLPYAQYGLFAVLALVSAVTGWLLVRDVAAVGVAVGGSMVATALIWRHVDPDRPARKVIGTVVRDWRRTEPPAEGPLPRLSARNVRIGGR